MRDASDSCYPPSPVPGDDDLPDGVSAYRLRPVRLGLHGHPVHVARRVLGRRLRRPPLSRRPQPGVRQQRHRLPRELRTRLACARTSVAEPGEILHLATTDPGEDTAAALRAEALALIAEDPLDWMNRSSLMRRLRELQAAHRRPGAP